MPKIATAQAESHLDTAPAPPREAAATALLPRRADLPKELTAQLWSGRELIRRIRRRQREPMPTGVSALDEPLGGGLPRGELVELVGRRSCGRFSAVLATLATATAAGEAVALVDLGDALDPRTAAAAGADLSRLLWLRPRTVRDALAAAESVLGGGFPLVVVDLGNPPVPGGRGALSAWMRLARATRPHAAALLVASPYRATGTAAATVLETASPRSVWAAPCGRRHTGIELLAGVTASVRPRSGGIRARTASPTAPLAFALQPPA